MLITLLALLSASLHALEAPECQQRIYCVRHRHIVDSIFTGQLEPLIFTVTEYSV